MAKGATSKEAAAKTSGGRVVEIVAQFQTEYYISGVAPCGDSLVLLAYRPPPPLDAAVAPHAAEGGDAAETSAWRVRVRGGG